MFLRYYNINYTDYLKKKFKKKLQKMPCGSSLTANEKGQIRTFKEVGQSNREVAMKINRSHTVCSLNIKKNVYSFNLDHFMANKSVPVENLL